MENKYNRDFGHRNAATITGTTLDFLGFSEYDDENGECGKRLLKYEGVDDFIWALEFLEGIQAGGYLDNYYQPMHCSFGKTTSDQTYITFLHDLHRFIIDNCSDEFTLEFEKTLMKQYMETLVGDFKNKLQRKHNPSTGEEVISQIQS